MNQYINKKWIITAMRWRTGVKFEGLSGDDPNKICGCVMIGSPHGSRPHFHVVNREGIRVIPIVSGDYIVFKDGKPVATIDEETFNREYVCLI